jgi:isopenicillin N synthase-like dioxygenase
MLERQTNGRLRSTTHRVVNPRGEAARRARYSMPFFLHFRPDFLITPLPECIGADDAAPPPAPITAHDFLMQRLREINLA